MNVHPPANPPADAHPGDPTAGHHGGNTESRAAHASVKANKAFTRNRIVDWIRRRGALGATADEVEVVSGMPHQTVSARITEAKKLGLIQTSGERRPTRSGRMAAVHIYSATTKEQ